MWLAPIILIAQNRYPCLGSGNNAEDRFTIALLQNNKEISAYRFT